MAELTTTAPTGVEGELSLLEELARTFEENARYERMLARRMRNLRVGRSQGRSWQDLLAREPAPGVLSLVDRVLRRVTEGSGALRRTVASGLRAEGATVPGIAEMFGVSHQRVSALLRRHHASGAGEV